MRTAPTNPGMVDRAQIKHRIFGTKSATMEQVTAKKVATAACGDASKAVFSFEYPNPDIISGLNCLRC